MTLSANTLALMDTDHLLSTCDNLPLTPLESVLVDRLYGTWEEAADWLRLAEEFDVSPERVRSILEASSATHEEMASMLYFLERENTTTTDQLKNVFAGAFEAAY